MVRRATVLTVVCCCLVVTNPFVAAVGATQSNSSTVDEGNNGTESGSGTVDRCFSDDGYEFTIGTQGPEIKMVLYMSLLTNPGGSGAFGIELTGSIDGPPIIELRTGVVSDGIESVTGFLNNPFGPFGIVFDYRFELPMFGDGFSHEESEPPIDGPVDGTDC